MLSIKTDIIRYYLLPNSTALQLKCTQLKHILLGIIYYKTLQHWNWNALNQNRYHQVLFIIKLYSIETEMHSIKQILLGIIYNQILQHWNRNALNQNGYY